MTAKNNQTQVSSLSLNAEKVRAARLSIVSNTVLVFLKLAIGLWVGSVAILSEAIHSATDLLAALLAFFAVRKADKPPDEQHPYGHGKLESLSGVGEALLILVAGIYIIVEAIRAILHPHPPEKLGWGIGVMLFSAGINTLIAGYLFQVARRTDSLAIEADAHHLSVDVYTSLGVTVGLILVEWTGRTIFDPLVALIVALFICYTGAKILRQATSPLLDERLPDEEIAQVEAIMTHNDQVLSWHQLRTRKSGSQRHIDVHIQVDDDMSLKDAHQLTEELEDEMRAALPNLHVVIHPEPYEEEKRLRADNPH